MRVLSMIVNRGATGTSKDLLPGLLDAVVDNMRARQDIDAASELTARELIRREPEMLAAVAALSPHDLKTHVAAIAEHHAELRETLFEAGPSLSPDAYAETLKLSTKVGLLQGQVDLLDLGISEGGTYDLESPGGKVIRGLIAKDLVGTLTTAARLQIAMREARL